MTIKCPNCRRFILDTDAYCPFCNMVNNEYRTVARIEPKTIAELQKWYDEEELPPPQETRIFIGWDYNQPNAIGIYYDPSNRHYVLYKN